MSKSCAISGSISTFYYYTVQYAVYLLLFILWIDPSSFSWLDKWLPWYGTEL